MAPAWQKMSIRPPISPQRLHDLDGIGLLVEPETRER